MDARLLALFVLALPPAALAQEASLPCSVGADAVMVAAEYGGEPRRNPDGTFYPGDAFYYVFRFSASGTCVGLSAGPVVSHDGLYLETHETLTWQDAGRWRPGQDGARHVDVQKARAHPHSDMSLEPRLLETVHYYWREGGPPMFSVREDSELQGWQKRALSGKDYRTESTHEWDFAARGTSHAHLLPCEPWMLERAEVVRGEADYGDGRCAVPDAFEDAASREKFAERAAELCSQVRLYSGCVFGKARIISAPGEPRCLKDELERMGVEAPGKDRCVAAEPRAELTVTGIKKTCGTNERGVFSCRAVPVPRTAELAPEVLAPDLGLELRHERVIDSDGYLARNADGTYYVSDPVAIMHEPALKWKDERHGTIKFEVSAEAQLPLESRLWCQEPCAVELERERTAPSAWNLGSGEGIAVHSAPGAGHLGTAGFEYEVRASNAGVPLGSATASAGAHIVPYEPVYSAYAYPALSDGGRTSYENRVGVALHYFGSLDGALHEGRRSKIDTFSYSGRARGPWEEVPLSAELEWSGARGAGLAREHAEAAARLHPGAAPWRAGEPCQTGRAGTLMAVSAGYCMVYFSYPVLGEIAGPGGPRLEGAVLRGELASGGMAGGRTALLEYEYRFAEPLFYSGLLVRAAGPDGSEAPVPLRVDVEPAGTPLPEYVRQKALRDTGDPGLAAIAAGGAYPSSYSERGVGSIDTKLRRVSSEFPTYGGSADAAGLGVEGLARAYLSSSSSARLEVPLDVGLGAPSPLRLTVTADGKARQYELAPDFGRDLEIVVNAAQDNPLYLERGGGYVEAYVPPWFGPAVAWYVDGNPYEASCPAECVLQAEGRGPVSVEAENAWGGRAAARAAGLPPEPPRPPASANLEALALFVLALPVVWWAYRRIRG